MSRAVKVWGFCTVLAVGAWSRTASFPFSLSIVILAAAVFVALFFLPAFNGWGSHVSRASWCRAGFCVACAYIIACGVAHQVAISRVRAFAATHSLNVEKIGALPLPPSFLDWNGMVLTPGGVYQSTFSLRDAGQPNFRLVPDSPPNRFTEEAARLLSPCRPTSGSHASLCAVSCPSATEGSSNTPIRAFSRATRAMGRCHSPSPLSSIRKVDCCITAGERARLVLRLKFPESVAPRISEHPR